VEEDGVDGEWGKGVGAVDLEGCCIISQYLVLTLSQFECIYMILVITSLG
jgi:hypothetical protein